MGTIMSYPAHFMKKAEQADAGLLTLLAELRDTLGMELEDIESSSVRRCIDAADAGDRLAQNLLSDAGEDMGRALMVSGMKAPRQQMMAIGGTLERLFDQLDALRPTLLQLSPSLGGNLSILLVDVGLVATSRDLFLIASRTEFVTTPQFTCSTWSITATAST